MPSHHRLLDCIDIFSSTRLVSLTRRARRPVLAEFGAVTWLAGCVYRPVFTHQPQSWREWWCGVRAFAAAWYGISAGSVSGHSPAVRALEREFGAKISPSVHEWAAFTTELREAGLAVRALRDRLTLGWKSGYEAVRLLTLGEGDVEWVVLREHLADEDPPVQCQIIKEWDDRVLESWQHTATTSEFALQQLIAYLDHPGGDFQVDMMPSPELLEELRSLGQTSIQLGQQTLIEGEDLLILVGESPFTNPDGVSTIRVEIGASRANTIPETLSNLAPGGRVWFKGTFAPGRDH
jgi:hypothetical protein